eukprot:8815038-Alexandrium_andersonii.AAC.1
MLAICQRACWSCHPVETAQRSLFSPARTQQFRNLPARHALGPTCRGRPASCFASRLKWRSQP